MGKKYKLLKWKLLEWLIERQYTADELLATKGYRKYGGRHDWAFDRLVVSIVPRNDAS
jgi:hypothetical protein